MSQNGVAIGISNYGDDDDIDQGSLAMIKRKCHVETVLVEAQRDLDNAEFHLPFIFNPLRKLVIGPALGIANFILPPVAKAIPVVDEVTAVSLSVPFDLTRALYMSLHSEQAGAQWKTYHDAMKEFDSLLSHQPEEPTSEREVACQKANNHTVKGFLITATVEFVSDPKSNLQQWLEYTSHLTAYIRAAGIDNEIGRTFSSSRLTMNARILGNIQSIDDNVQKRRIKTAIPGATFDICPKVVAK